MYWLRKNSDPNMAKNTKVTASDAAVNRGFLKKRTSSIGCGLCSSHSTNEVSSTTPMANAPRIVELAHPFDGPSITP